MTSDSEAGDSSEPIIIARLGKRYFVYNVESITHIRKNYQICGVLIGSIPQMPQQNVFLGIPLELMPEEARLLVDQGVAYVVDDAKWHNEDLKNLSHAERMAFERDLDTRGRSVAHSMILEAKARQTKALQKLKESGQKASKKGFSEETEDSSKVLFSTEDTVGGTTTESSSTHMSASTQDLIPWGWTPTSSYPPLRAPANSDEATVPPVPSSYPLFKHLNSKGFFLSPGLRFGCQYLAYPGDPLRFHSHFLAVGADWNEEIDLIDIVAGGRLGTGVKKGYLIGGANTDDTNTLQTHEPVRTFCIEWGGM